MRKRCLNPTVKDFPRYGGRGIRICERWGSFELFVSDMGPRPSPTHTLERIDVNGDYSPENCRWATVTEQNQNRRNTVYVQFRGTKRRLKEITDELGVDYFRIYARLKYGWPLEEALFGRAS